MSSSSAASYRARVVSSFSIRRYSQSVCRGTGLAVSGGGRTAVVDQAEPSVKLFSRLGKETAELAAGCLRRPWDVALLPGGGMVVSDPAAGEVKIFTDDGRYVRSFASLPHMVEPYGVAVTSRGEVLVADKGAGCVYVHDRDGFVQHCVRPAGLVWPQYVAVDSHDHVVVTDFARHTLAVYDRAARCLLRFGGQGTQPGQLMCPAGVCVDAADNVIVADSANGRVQLVAADGRSRQVLVSTGLDAPQAVTIDDDGRLIVLDGHDVTAYDYTS